MERLVTCIAQVWLWPILPHKHAWNPEGSLGSFYELWALVPSIAFQLDWGQVIGWAILEALFSFCETNWEFLDCVFGISVLLKCPNSFHFHHPGRWQQIFIKNVSVHLSVHPSFDDVKSASAVCWTALLVWGFSGDMQCLLTSKHGVCYGIQRVQFWSICPDYILPVLQALSNVMLFSSAVESEVWWTCVQAMEVESLLIVFFQTCCTCWFQVFLWLSQVVLYSWTTPLIILFTPLSEILRGAPGRGWFMVKWCSFHFLIMASTLLSGTFSSL